MSSFKNGVLPCPFGECGDDCEWIVVEYDDGEDGFEDGGEKNGGIKGGFSPFPPLPFGVLSPYPLYPIEYLSPF